MTVGPSNEHLSRILRQQLQELRIDPDAVSVAPRPRLGGLKRWLGQHSEAVVLAGVAGVVLMIICGTALLVSTQVAATSNMAGNAAPRETTVSFGNLVVEITQPAYHRYAAGQGSVLLHLQLHNTSSVQARLLAGDLLLADSRGALFPPSWVDSNGNSVDGLKDPTHVFLALDPNSATEIDLPFLVLGDGPFSLRYARAGTYADAVLPVLTLSSSP